MHIMKALTDAQKSETEASLLLKDSRDRLIHNQELGETSADREQVVCSTPIHPKFPNSRPS